MNIDSGTPVTRRRFIHDAACVATAAIVSANIPRRRVGPADGRMAARPVATPTDRFPPGAHTLSTTQGRDTMLFVPTRSRSGQPTPLLLGFHGATEDMTILRDSMQDAAETAGVILVLPSSAGVTWDAIRGQYGPDLAHVDETLSTAFRHCAVDTRRIAIGGFSDGASYGTSLGLVNGDLFTHVVAMSAGFIIPGVRHGRPQIFIAHGTRDRILPIDQCGRRIASELQGDGYSVQFVEFDGGHQIRPEIVTRALQWLAT